MSDFRRYYSVGFDIDKYRVRQRSSNMIVIEEEEHLFLMSKLSQSAANILVPALTQFPQLHIQCFRVQFRLLMRIEGHLLLY